MKLLSFFVFLFFFIIGARSQSKYDSNFKSKSSYDSTRILSMSHVEGDFYISLFLKDIKTDSVYKIVIPVYDYCWERSYNIYTQDSKEIQLVLDSILSVLKKDTIYTNEFKKYKKYIVEERFLIKLSLLSIEDIVKKYVVNNDFINLKNHGKENALIYYFDRKLIIVGIADMSGKPGVNFNYAAYPDIK